LKDNLGVEIELLPLDPPAYFQQVLGGRQFELTGVGWGADYPDPENFLAPLFITGSPNNIGGYSNPEFDQLAVSALQELDQEKRLGLWMGAHEVLVRDAPLAPFFYQERFFLKKPSVRGLTLTGIDGAIPGDTRLTEIFISP
jgi:oligopeptide transport system substrate-binding protein